MFLTSGALTNLQSHATMQILSVLVVSFAERLLLDSSPFTMQSESPPRHLHRWSFHWVAFTLFWNLKTNYNDALSMDIDILILRTLEVTLSR